MREFTFLISDLNLKQCIYCGSLNIKWLTFEIKYNILEESTLSHYFNVPSRCLMCLL